MTQITVEGSEDFVAEFEEYNDAVRCLAPMARALKRSLEIIPMVGDLYPEPLPRGCFTDSIMGKTTIVARP